MEWLFHLDASLLLWIQENLRVSWLTPFFKQITKLGNVGWFWIFLTVILLLIPKQRRTGAMCAASLVGSVVVNNLFLKNVVARTRPYEVVEGLTRLIEKQSDYSFPSGHTASFAAAVILFLQLPKKIQDTGTHISGADRFSRLYLGVHYPTDVLAGAVSGTLIALAVHWIFERKKKSTVRIGIVKRPVSEKSETSLFECCVTIYHRN